LVQVRDWVPLPQTALQVPPLPSEYPPGEDQPLHPPFTALLLALQLAAAVQLPGLQFHVHGPEPEKPLTMPEEQRLESPEESEEKVLPLSEPQAQLPVL
jgi:hypothetical protein